MAGILVRVVRNVLLTDLILAVLVGLICLLLQIRSFDVYGTLLGWAGTAMILFGGFTAVGGFAARAQDAVAFSRTGAGDMIENLQRISDARSSNLGCFLHLFLAGLGLIALANLVHLIPDL